MFQIKKLLLASTITLMLGLSFSTLVDKSFAQQSGLLNRIDSLNADIPFGYAPGQKISIKSIDNQKVTIQSPLIIDDLGGKIKKYTVMYSEYTLDELLNQTTLLNQAKEKTFTFTGTQATISMDLGLVDGIVPTKAYYILVMPKDDQGVGGQISNELWFKLGDKTYGEGVYTGTIAPHAAAGANMSLANITHTCNPDCSAAIKGSKKITLKRISVAGSDIVDISLMIDGIDIGFNKLATVNMSDESYEIQTNKNGAHTFKFTPNNGGTEKTYLVNISGITTGTGTAATGSITKVPRTGPKENIFIAILITLGLYFGYKKLHA